MDLPDELLALLQQPNTCYMATTMPDLASRSIIGIASSSAKSRVNGIVSRRSGFGEPNPWSLTRIAAARIERRHGSSYDRVVIRHPQHCLRFSAL